MRGTDLQIQPSRLAHSIAPPQRAQRWGASKGRARCAFIIRDIILLLPNECCSRQALFGCDFVAMVVLCLQLN
jgi:hypothetical protein